MQNLKKIEEQIEKLKIRLAHIDKLRPGTLRVQYRKPTEQKMSFHQISYTHKGKSHSEYVRAENLDTIKKEIANYKRFRDIIEQLIELSIQASRIRCQRKNSSRRSSSSKPHSNKCTESQMRPLALLFEESTFTIYNILLLYEEVLKMGAGEH